MDFDIAARRLQADQKSALAKSRASRSARTASAKAKREAKLARDRAERRLKEKKIENERNSKIEDRVARGVRRAERSLGVSNVSPPRASAATDGGKQQQSQSSSSALFATSPLSSGWELSATSIHGEGDKIALPPSILEAMTSSNSDLDPWGGGRNGRPIAFRIGVANPEYEFPSSDKMRALVESVRKEVIAEEKDELSRQNSSVGDAVKKSMNSENAEGSDDETDDSDVAEAYLDELSHRYLAYTHGTVVEFTQEDGCVGLPEPVARALLQPNSHSLGGNAVEGRQSEIPVKRTVDPASAAVTNGDSKHSGDDDDAMDVDAKDNTAQEEDTGEKTPGHPAYGLFDVPALPIEITPINALPPGKNCTFTPTAQSIKNGFYALKDVKLVMEQSLMRTRATLSRGDVIRTWRRGVSFDLIVSSLAPADYGAVSCVNTDLNVDIGPPEGEPGETATDKVDSSNGDVKDQPKPLGGGGRLLSEPSSQTQAAQSTSSTSGIPKKTIELPKEAIELPPEPPEGTKDGVCNVQIRGRTSAGSTAAGRRRFDVTTATMSDLFAFASHVCDGADPSSFRLVTRFPRRVFELSNGGDSTLESAGIGQGQEMFMVESL